MIISIHSLQRDHLGNSTNQCWYSRWSKQKRIKMSLKSKLQKWKIKIYISFQQHIQVLRINHRTKTKSNMRPNTWNESLCRSRKRKMKNQIKKKPNDSYGWSWAEPQAKFLSSIRFNMFLMQCLNVKHLNISALYTNSYTSLVINPFPSWSFEKCNAKISFLLPLLRERNPNGIKKCCVQGTLVKSYK